MGHGIDLFFPQIGSPGGLLLPDLKVQHPGDQGHVVLPQAQGGEIPAVGADGGEHHIILSGEPFALQPLPAVIDRHRRAAALLVGHQGKGPGPVHGGGENGAGQAAAEVFRIAVGNAEALSVPVVNEHVFVRNTQGRVIVPELNGIAAVPQSADKGIGVSGGHRQTHAKGPVRSVQTRLEPVFGEGIGEGAGRLCIGHQAGQIFWAKILPVAENAEDHTGQHPDERQGIERAGDRQTLVLTEAGDVAF